MKYNIILLFQKKRDYSIFKISRHASVYASCKKEVLHERDDLDLAHVVEEFVELVLVLHVKNHVRAEHEDRRGEIWQDFETLKAERDPVYRFIPMQLARYRRSTTRHRAPRTYSVRLRACTVMIRDGRTDGCRDGDCSADWRY